MASIPKGITEEELCDPHFVAQYPVDIAEYIEHRVRGHSPQVSAIRVWGSAFTDRSAHALLSALEGNKYVANAFAARLRTITFDEMWSSKTSIHELLSLVRDTLFTKDAVRLNAMKELNVMVGITVTDENGKTKAGRSLADFYADVAANANPRPIPGEEPKADGDKVPLPH